MSTTLRLKAEKNPHPLGLNFTPGTPYVMLLQQAYWEPNTYFRTGTFHKLFGDRWISYRHFDEDQCFRRPG